MKNIALHYKHLCGQAVVRRVPLDMEGSTHSSNNYVGGGSGSEGGTPKGRRGLSAPSTSGRGTSPRVVGPATEERVPLRGANGRIKSSDDGGQLGKDERCEAAV